MAKKAKSSTRSPSTAELVEWLRALRLQNDGVAEPVMIPGLDSYAPSYLSGGASAGHGEQPDWEHGKLE
jgi:hypothetical protein